MTPDEIVSIIQEFDPSDAYHTDDLQLGPLNTRAYYAALDRCVRAVNGELADWKDLGGR